MTGGAGYIGSHMVKMLRLAGYQVVVIDDLSAGFLWAVQGAELIQGSIGESDLMEQCLVSKCVDAVIHFAGSISVGESMQRPDLYYRNNIANTLTLLDAMNEKQINKIIFSSTAAIFGDSAGKKQSMRAVCKTQ